MSVTAMRLQNFMAFEDTKWIELEPITLVFGRNSSGKSAIIRALRLLRQSLTEAPADSPFAYAIEDGVDVGEFLSMAHRRAVAGVYESGKETLVFGFRCSVPEDSVAHSRWGEYTKATKGNVELNLVLEYAWRSTSRDRKGLAVLKSLAVETVEENTILYIDDVSFQDKPEERHEEPIWVIKNPAEYYDSEELSNWLGIRLDHGFLPRISPRASLRPSEKPLVLTDIDALLEVLNKEISEFLGKIEYVRPIRPEPRRYYMLDASQQRRWQRQGLEAFLRMLRNKDGEFDAIKPTVGDYLSTLDLGATIAPKAITDNLPPDTIFARLQLDEGKGGFLGVDLVDVGSGTAQVVPIIVQSLMAEPGSTVIIEQPELHLHPRAQAELANLFVDAYREYGTCFIIETHSEHILSRLRLHVAETNLRSVLRKKGTQKQNYITRSDLRTGELGINFVIREKGTSKLMSILLRRNGEYAEKPEEFKYFFADDAIAIMAIADAIFEAEDQEYGGDA